MKFICNYWTQDSSVLYTDSGLKSDVVLYRLNKGIYLMGKPQGSELLDDSNLLDAGVIGIYEPSFWDRLFGKLPPQ